MVNWKDAAIERLRRYEYMKIATQSLPDQLAELEVEAVNLKAAEIDRVRVRSSAEPGSALINNLVIREELQHALDQAKLWVKITERALNVLKPEEKLVLYRMYISRERGALDRLCEELECEVSTVYRRKDAALWHFTIALYGFVES